MKRLSLFGSWKRLGVQVGLLAGVGVAFIGGADPTPAVAAQVCVMEDQCSFRKPLFMIIADYSTSMNNAFGMQGTRWDAAVDAIVQMVDADNGYLQGNVLLGLMRFGHDPNPNAAGTTINGDTSGITDGYKLDVGFYDENDPGKAYFHCNGEAIKTAITTVAPPMNGNLTGIGTWTKNSLDRTQAYIQQTWNDHPPMMGENQRQAAIVLLTDGQWTGPLGNENPPPPAHNPSITSGNLYNMMGVPTYVVYIGEAQDKGFADEIAMMGGTGTAYDANNAQALVDALKAVVQDLIMDVIQPTCAPGLPRIMVLLDASSSMLNVGGLAGPMGTTGWDQARDALSGNNSLFDQIVMGDQAVENLVHLGLAVFGHNLPAPGEQKILVDYGPCMKDNFAWALDPNTSCEAPGCTDPWNGPVITWTFKESPPEIPPNNGNPPTPFDQLTRSHMPQCGPGQAGACVGSGTYTHLGLQLIKNNINTYKAACADPMAPYPCDANTKFINILITDGNYDGYSTDQQVQSELEQMYNDGITTYVIGFGDGPGINQLNNMAGWGSGGMEMAYDANNQAALEAALASIIEGITFDPCCGFNNCAQNPEPGTNEPDPLPMDTTSTGTGTDTDTGTGTGTDTDTGGMTTMMPVTDSGTTDSGTSAGPTTDEPTSGTPATDSDSQGMTSEPTTTATTNTTQTTTPGTGTDSATGTDTDSTDSATTGGQGTDDGCGCKVDEEGQTRGLLASLFTLGLAGFIRRRRRAA